MDYPLRHGRGLLVGGHGPWSVGVTILQRFYIVMRLSVVLLDSVDKGQDKEIWNEVYCSWRAVFYAAGRVWG